MIETRDISQFSDIRTKARAYFCYLFTKNLPNKLPSVSPDRVMDRLRKIQGDLKDSEGVYLLDDKGIQLSPTYLNDGNVLKEDMGSFRTSRAYYYRAMKEKRCTITDPYPSLITKNLTVTVSQPIFDENNNIKFVACLDMSLESVIKIGQATNLNKTFSLISKFTYSMFAIALGIVAMLLFIKAIQAFSIHGFNILLIDAKDIFSATILLTLSLAIFDLVKTLFEEEVIGKEHSHEEHSVHKTMVRFLGSIIIALSIEALLLVFKFAMNKPDQIVNAIYLIIGVSLLMISLGVYTKLVTHQSSDKK
jgi:hypothetical protein